MSVNDHPVHAVEEDGWCDVCGDYAPPVRPLLDGVNEDIDHIKVSTLLAFWTSQHQAFGKTHHR